MTHECQAAVLHQPGQPLTVEEISIAAPGSGEVLIRTAAAGICGTDLRFAAGTIPYPVPTVLGHEAAGTVLATGPGVNDVAEGDRVLVCDQTFCGRCGPCLSGSMVYCTDPGAKTRQRQRLHIAGQPARQYLGVSGFAELMLVDANCCIRIPDALSFPAGALLACCLTTGLAAVFNIAKPTPGAKVAVFGCGGVGLGAIQAARIAGATQIIAVDLKDHRLTAATEVGATITINANHTDPVEAIQDFTRGGVEYAIEAVGLPLTAVQAFTVLAPGGRATVLGMMPAGADLTLPAGLLRHGRNIGGTVMGSVRTRADIPRYIDLAVTGLLRTEPLITCTTPLHDIQDAMTTATARNGIRSMISF